MYLDENGKEKPIVMGSYGIGIERILACFIEQNYDDKGIVWKDPLNPFDIHLIGLNMKNENISKACEQLYIELTAEGYDVLFDDRIDASAGFKFNDADLLGMPVQVIVGEKNLKAGNVEVKNRRTGIKNIFKLDELLNKLQEPI
jgi:prolyl-tRNA synthetase